MSEVQQVGGTRLIGRVAELARIDIALGDPTRRGVFLVGAAGVGKTRLAEEARQRARAANMAVVSASANATSARLSLGALAHILPPASDLGDLHHDLQPAHLLQAARRTLGAEAGDRRLVLSIDDAHHLDPVGAQLVSQLVAVDSAFVIATIRSGEKVPEAITELLRDPTVERIDLGGLPSADIGPVASGILGAFLDADALTWLAITSAGNALFLRELVLAGRDDGTLTFDSASGVWRLHPTRQAISPRLSELLELRVDGLSDDERRSVDAIGLAEPLPLDVAEELLGLDALDALDRRGLLRVVADGRRLTIGLSHPLYIEAIKRAPMSLRKRTDLGRMVQAVEGRGARRRDDPIRLASWQLARGGRADPDVLLRAALAAQLAFDDHVALDLATAGLAQDPGPSTRVELLLCVGLSRSRLGRFLSAIPDLQTASATAVAPDQIARAAIRWAAATLEANGDLLKAVAILDHALARLERSQGPDVDVRLERATLLADGGFTEAAADELRRIDASDLTASQRILLALAEGSERLGAGRPLEAIAAADRGLHHHLSNLGEATTYHPASHFLPRILGLIDSGQLDTAERDAAWMQQRGAEERRPIAQTASRLFRAMVRLRRGDPSGTIETVTFAQAHAPAEMQPYLRRIAWCLLAQAHAQLGDPAASRRALDENNATPLVIDGFGGIEYALAEASVLRAEGHGAEAAASLRVSLDHADAKGNARISHAVLDELLHRHGDLDSARRLSSATRGDALARARACAADAALGTSWDVYDEAARDFAALGFAARAFEFAQRGARGAALDGNTRMVSRLERTAAEAAGNLDPALRRLLVGDAAAVDLTGRELEIALLVCRGATSKEVAEQLHLSARTVDNHLQRIFTKLGVSNRRELARLLGRGHNF